MGGAGPLHGAEVAKMLQVPEVIVPLYPGISSAMGLLTADLKYEAIRTQFQISSSLDLVRIENDFSAMASELTARFGADGVDVSEVSFQRSGDLRYVGQGYELKVAINDGRVNLLTVEQLWRDFHKIHGTEYGHTFEDSPIEIVNIRCTAVGNLPKLTRLNPSTEGSFEAALQSTRDGVFRSSSGLESFKTDVFKRDLLPIGQTFFGPAILLQKDSTTVLPPETSAYVHPSGSVIIKLEAMR
jgi:N-methylhydantoinase A